MNEKKMEIEPKALTEMGEDEGVAGATGFDD